MIDKTEEYVTGRLIDLGIYNNKEKLEEEINEWVSSPKRNIYYSKEMFLGLIGDIIDNVMVKNKFNNKLLFEYASTVCCRLERE